MIKTKKTKETKKTLLNLFNDKQQMSKYISLDKTYFDIKNIEKKKVFFPKSKRKKRKNLGKIYWDHRKKEKEKQRLKWINKIKKTPGKRYRKSIPYIKKKNLNRKKIDGSAIFKYTINISIKQHNVFCTLTTTKENKTLHVCSAGKYKVKMSKKTLIYSYYWFLRRFFATVKKIIRVPSVKKMLSEHSKIIRRAGIIVKLIGPRKIRPNLVKTTRFILRKRPFFLIVSDEKVFNGCRPPKKVRKKRRRMRNSK